jgi:hypothetical protein
VITSETSFDGSKALKLILQKKRSHRVSQIISPVTPLAQYELSAAIKTSAVSSNVHVAVEWQTVSGALIRTDTFGDTSGTADWSVQTSPLLSAPIDAAKAILLLISDKGTGTGYFDAVTFREFK